MMKNIIKRLIIVLLVGTFLISIFFILKDKNEDKKEQTIFEELANKVKLDIIDEENSTNELTSDFELKQKELTIDMEELYRENNDIVGWLQILDTNINYPVVQNLKNPLYYLRRNFYGEYSVWGTPFIMDKVDMDKSDNIIIYGHHINGNKMFGELEKYRDIDFYNKHKKINLYTNKGKREYTVISAFVTTTNNDFEYYNYINFYDSESFETFINKCKKLSFFETNEKVKYGDKILTLSTCDYTLKNGRFVVIARQEV